MAKTVLDLFRLTDRRALVTGGSKGLGKVIATALAQAGADVAIAARHADEASATAVEISSATARVIRAFSADVSRAEEIDRLVSAVESTVGPIDILVNNAGNNIRGAAHELSESDWDTVLDLNLKSPFMLVRHFAPKMAERNWGRIINLGSILSAVGVPGRAPYASSKAGILGLTRVLALEYATKGVTVNAICPGPFATDMNKPLLEDPAKYQAFVAKIPMARWGDLHEIAGAALFLASDASSYVTGSALYVDGGWTAQ